MPALLTVEAIIILHRPVETEDDKRDPCLWLLEGPMGSSHIRFVRFYATEIEEMLLTLSELKLDDSEESEQLDAVKHTTVHSHEVKLKGKSRPGQPHALDWEISLSYAFHKLPFQKLVDSIRSMRKDMPADCVQVWPETRANKVEFMQYIERLRKNPQPGAVCFEPISIVR